MSTTGVDHGTVTVTADEAADWIVRSALPQFLDLLTLSDHAQYFYRLHPFSGHTPTGRLRGWQGAGVKLAAAEEAVNSMYFRFFGVEGRFSRYSHSAVETEARRACVFARRVMLPSLLGCHAYRLIGRASQLAKGAAESIGGGLEAVDDTWRTVFDAVTDRARLRPLAEDRNAI